MQVSFFIPIDFWIRTLLPVTCDMRSPSHSIRQDECGDSVEDIVLSEDITLTDFTIPNLMIDLQSPGVIKLCSDLHVLGLSLSSNNYSLSL